MLPIISPIKSKFVFLKKAVMGIAIGGFLIILTQLFTAPLRKNLSWAGDSNIQYSYNKFQDSLIRQLAYNRAVERSLATDSIYMVISIPDSTLSIGINGVKFYTTKIQNYELDRFLNNINATTVLRQFQQPLQSKESYSSIVKEPIKIKIAPKNEEEAAKMVTLPDTAVFIHAKVSYLLENDLQLTMEGSLKEGWFEIKWNSLVDFLINTFSKGEKIALATAHFEIYNYQPTIHLTLDNIDLTSIYRALPERPAIIIYY